MRSVTHDLRGIEEWLNQTPLADMYQPIGSAHNDLNLPLEGLPYHPTRLENDDSSLSRDGFQITFGRNEREADFF
jgi:hypothetical protein